MDKECVLRPEVEWFARKMEARLREKEPENPAGWKRCSTFYLILRLQEQAGKLAEALLTGSPEGVVIRSVDMSNFCLMLADVQKAQFGEVD